MEKRGGIFQEYFTEIHKKVKKKGVDLKRACFYSIFWNETNTQKNKKNIQNLQNSSQPKDKTLT